MNKISIVVQGPSYYVDRIKNNLKDFKNDIIFSTWKGEEEKYENEDIVIFNDIPHLKGITNFNCQKISTLNGLKKSKELGYTHSLKLRSDYIITNPKEFFGILEYDKLNFNLWCMTESYPTLNGYFGDQTIFGPIDSMIELWNIEDNFCGGSEITLTWNYIKKLKNKIDINYFLKDLNEKNDIYNIKINQFDSIFKNNNLYNRSVEETKIYMNETYLNFLKYYQSKWNDKKIKNKELPLISIFNPNKINVIKQIYLNDRYEIVETKDKINGDFVILSEDLIHSSSLMIEYLKKINCYYTGGYYVSEINPGHDPSKSKLKTIDEFFSIKIN